MHFQSVSPSYLILRSMLGLGFWHFFCSQKRRGEKFAQKIYQTRDDSFCVYDDENLYLFFFFFLPDEKRKKKRKISERIVFLVQFKFFVFFFSFLVKEFLDFPTVFALGVREKKNDDTDKSKHRRLRHRPEIRRESKRRVCRWVVNRRRDIRRARVFVRAAVKQTHLEREKSLGRFVGGRRGRGGGKLDRGKGDERDFLLLDKIRETSGKRVGGNEEEFEPKDCGVE